MSNDTLDSSSGNSTPETTPSSSNTLSADVAADISAYLEERAITDAFDGLMSCHAVEGKNPRSTILLGTNAETLILSHNQDGTWYSLVWDKDFQLPKDIMIRGRNVLVSYFWDGSVRIESVNATGINPEDGFRWNWTRLDESEVTLTWKGKIYTDYIIILDGKWGFLTQA